MLTRLSLHQDQVSRHAYQPFFPGTFLSHQASLISGFAIEVRSPRSLHAVENFIESVYMVSQGGFG